MKLKIGSTFDFTKLKRYVNSQEFGDFLSNVTVNPIVKGSKEKIINGKVRPVLKPSTRKQRRYGNKKSVNTPLYDTGALYKSLQMSDVRSQSGVLKGLKGMMMEKYGLYHLQGFKDRSGKKVPKRNFLAFKSTGKSITQIIKKFREKFNRRLKK
tara:strand:+ start:137 stop:598 length:462 start_codon:yes stop_codon:yes gene_type:complete